MVVLHCFIETHANMQLSAFFSRTINSKDKHDDLMTESGSIILTATLLE
jgi:hypothetical protein